MAICSAAGGARSSACKSHAVSCAAHERDVVVIAGINRRKYFPKSGKTP